MIYHLIINIFFIFINIIFNTISSYYNTYKAETIMNKPYNPLIDIIQDNIIKTYIHLPDYLLGIVCISTFIKLYIYNCNLYNLYLNLYSLNLSLLLRSVTITVTILPSCIPISFNNKKKNIYEKLFNSSHDLIFSGHTIVFTFLSKLLIDNSNNYVIYIGNIIQYLFPITLITSRQHYTIDVLIAMIIYRFFMFNVEYYNFI